MIAVTCFLCGNELSTPGALYFTKPENDRVTKRHLCELCAAVVEDFFTVCRSTVEREIRGAAWEGETPIFIPAWISP